MSGISFGLFNGQLNHVLKLEAINQTIRRQTVKSNTVGVMKKLAVTGADFNVAGVFN